MSLTNGECEMIENEMIAAGRCVRAFEAWARDVRKIPVERLAANEDGILTDPEVKNLSDCWSDAWCAGRVYERLHPRKHQ